MADDYVDVLGPPPVVFRDARGQATVIVPANVAAVEDAPHYPGSRFRPYCTVYLVGGGTVKLEESASDVTRKLWPTAR